MPDRRATELPEAPPEASSDGEDDHQSTGVENVSVTQSGSRAITVQTAAEVLATRHFRGLDLSQGSDRAFGVVQGRTGIASGYAHEPDATARLPEERIMESRARPPESTEPLASTQESTHDATASREPPALTAEHAAPNTGEVAGAERGEEEGGEDAMERAMQEKAGEVDAFFDAFD